MKKLILTALGILALASSNSNIAFANPICQSSASDPDGDGWGWENGASCIVDSSSGGGSSGGGGGGTPICQSSASDPDGDGWGWENDASCIVASSDFPGACITDSTGVEGWNGTRTCYITDITYDDTNVRGVYPCVSSSQIPANCITYNL